MGLVVSIGDNHGKTGFTPGVLGEMTVDSHELGYVAEMITDPAKLDSFIPGASAKAKALAESAGDDKPEFPVVRVEEGWSNNRRLWDAEELGRIAEQVCELEPVAHLGHMKEEDIATAFPAPQTTWLSATTKVEPSKLKTRLGEPVTVFYAAGYNLPNAQIRTYLKSRAVRGVSWLGFGQEIAVPGKGVQIKGFKLKALDWARKHAEGMPGTSVVAIASEMNGGTVSDKALSQVTPEEYKNENPNGYQLIVIQAKAESETLVSEMEGKIAKAEKDQTLLGQVRAALGISDDADPLTAIATAMKRLGEEARVTYEKLLDRELLKRIPGDDDDSVKNRVLVRRLVFSTEMIDQLKDVTDEAAADKLVGEQVERQFNEDDVVKNLISEQTSPVIRRREELRGTGEGKKSDYLSESTVQVN